MIDGFFFIYLFLGFILLILQVSFIPVLLPEPLQPDILVIIVFYAGFSSPTWIGALTAFSLGYLIDLFSGTLLGVSSFSMVVIFLFVYYITRHVDIKNNYFRFFGAMVLEFFYLLLLYLLQYLFHGGEPSFSFTSIVFPRMLTTGILSPLLIGIFERYI